MDGYDDKLEDSEQEDKWEEWFCNVAIDKIQEYHRKNLDNCVVMYLKGEIPSDDSGGVILDLFIIVNGFCHVIGDML